MARSCAVFCIGNEHMFSPNAECEVQALNTESKCTFRMLNGSSLISKRCIWKRKRAQTAPKQNGQGPLLFFALKMRTCSPHARSGRCKPGNTESKRVFRVENRSSLTLERCIWERKGARNATTKKMAGVLCCFSIENGHTLHRKRWSEGQALKHGIKMNLCPKWVKFDP